MSLARSMSGPGGLSINTSSANSLFGSSTTPATGGMFGNTQANKPASGGLFGASTTTSSAPASGGLFRSTAATTQSGGLFGSTATTSAPAAGGLFGSTATASQPQSGGLFGSSTTATQAQPQPSGGLFAGLGTQPAQNQNTGGGLFGSNQQGQNQTTGGGLFGPNNTSQPAQGQTGGLFGGLNSQPQQKSATSLFGGLGNTQNQQNQQPQPQATSMLTTLGQNQNQSGGLGGSMLGGGLSLGQPNNQQQQTVPGVRIDMSNIRGTTRFNDLHEDLQKQISNIDAVIQAQIQLKNDCEAIMPSHEAQLKQVPNDVEFCRRKLIGVENGHDSDVQSIAAASQLVKTDAENAKLSFKAVDNLRLPPQYHTSGIWSANDSRSQSNGDAEREDIVGFFSKTADELSATLARYQSHITEIEQHLRGVEAASAQQINTLVAKRNGGSRAYSDPVEDLTAVLRDFEQSLLGVAGKVGGAREAVQTLQLDGFSAPANGRPVNGKRSGVY